MKLTRFKKIFLFIAITAFVVLLFTSNTAFAAINTEYSTFDTVTDEALDEAYEGSTLMNLLAKLIYAVGRLLEWILGTIFKMLTGSSDFPWADKIVFNSVPLLDVNFINPGEGSFVANGEIIAVLKNTYATILTLAASFFGIIVLITSIKLVISTIASDKAKYKQAIVDWLVGFVMLFCIHYAISFIFYLNEQLVLVASRMVTENLKDASSKVVQVATDSVVQELIDNVTETGATYNGESVATIFTNNKGVVLTWQNKLKWGERSKGATEGFMKDMGAFNSDWLSGKGEQYERLGMLVKWAADSSITVKKLQEVKDSIKVYIYPGDILEAAQAISTVNFTRLFGKYADDAKKYLGIDDKKSAFQASTTPAGANEDNISLVVYGDDGYGEYTLAVETDGYWDDEQVKYVEFEEEGKYYLDIKKNTYHKWDGKKRTSDYYLSSGAGKFGVEGVADITNFYWTDLIDDLILIKKSGSGSEVGSSEGLRLVSDLAEYFRFNSYSKEARPNNVTGVKNGKSIQIQNMIMYAVLVVQSLILFIAYVKRLFYVILLAMMAPIVVVFDFFQKFGK